MAHDRIDGHAAAAGPDGARILTGMALGIAALLLAGQAGAAVFTPPAGCTLDLTAQNRSCTVTHYYTCAADPEGHRHSAHFGRDGLFHLATIDAETRWIESTSVTSGIVDRLVDEAESHASLSRLLETGRDDFDFWTESADGIRLRHQGHDELTGETATIGGRQLDRTRFRLTTRSEGGDLLITREGSQFVSRELNRFFGGTETSSDWTGETRQTDDSPVLFIPPGAAGFGSTTPQFDCDQLLTQIPQERAAS
ncbi:hypothetical protein D3P06_06470 [Paracoccus aestuarii]|uniref:DUF1849 family protein n=1 Tax=Paracoccus aestuarii TaxID=453842 RepID=A0A418ZYE6_9RHOB|nr:hypothetical protein [Paracoccus aestuarii]RJL05562.1 hypothetical protein D3P06_06470 [Paracoccus aestuarii]WCQ99448.1 hypothetical protein JHW48_01460 [Paracoccus aestuarii]